MQVGFALEAQLWNKADNRLRQDNNELSRTPCRSIGLRKLKSALSLQVGLALEAHLWSKADNRLRQENNELSRTLCKSIELLKLKSALHLQVGLALEAHLWSKADNRLRQENDELSRRLTALERGGAGRNGAANPFTGRGLEDKNEEDDQEFDDLLDQVCCPQHCVQLHMHSS